MKWIQRTGFFFALAFMLQAGAVAGEENKESKTTAIEAFRKGEMGILSGEKTVYEEVTGTKTAQESFHLLLNMQAGFDMHFDDVRDHGEFKMHQLRLEMKGQLNDWLSYRYRQRLNRGNEGAANIDNLPTSIDIAGIGIKLSDKVSLFAGKQCAAYGGFEFDINPIEVYEYSDMLNYMRAFFTGLNVAYDFIPGQQLQFQVLNSRNEPFADLYGQGFEDCKLPLLYTVNWNGNFKEVFKTRWSASLMNEAKGKHMFYTAFGNELTLGRFNGYLDFMYANQDIDKKGILSDLVAPLEVGSSHTQDARYTASVLKLNYRLAPCWNVFVKGMYDTAAKARKSESAEKGVYRRSYGYLAGVEYYPMKTNLHFFLSYIGRSYQHTDKAKALGFADGDTHRVSIGFVYQLPAL